MNFFHIVLDIHAQNRKICLREEGEEFNGLQFLILGTRLLDCQHGMYRPNLSNSNQKGIKFEKKVKLNMRIILI